MTPHFKSEQQLKWIPVWYVGVLFLIFLPQLIALIALVISGNIGCPVQNPNGPCLWHGMHLEGLLTNMYRSFYFMFATIPAGLIVLVVLTFISIHDINYYKRKI